jgi:hypothetical protein
MPAIPTSISAQPAAATVAATDRLPLDQEVGAPVAATALVVGLSYRIVSIGTGTNWTAAGAGDSPAVGTVFKCVATGTGTGTAQRLETRYALPGQMWPKPTDSLTLEGLTVTGTSNLAHIHGALAGLVYEHVRNTSGASLSILTPYRVTGSQGDTDRVTIVAARADNAALMPASGILATALNNNADGHGAISGVMTGVNTAGLVSGQQLYVAPTGGLTPTRPAVNIQPIAIVGRAHSNTGTLVVLPGPALSLAAFTGAYGDLTGRPDLSVYLQRRELRQAVGAWSGGLQFSYIGSAPPGSAESAAVWTVRRTTQNTAGAIVATASATGPWSNYASLPY